jgi:hypothetical protein
VITCRTILTCPATLRHGLAPTTAVGLDLLAPKARIS